MPLVEYRCAGCEQTIEVIQKFSDPDLTICSECGGVLERLLSAPAIRFKGSGWYINDYAAKGKNGNGSAPKSDAPASTPASDTSKSSEVTATAKTADSK